MYSMKMCAGITISPWNLVFGGIWFCSPKRVVCVCVCRRLNENKINSKKKKKKSIGIFCGQVESISCAGQIKNPPDHRVEKGSPQELHFLWWDIPGYLAKVWWWSITADEGVFKYGLSSGLTGRKCHPYRASLRARLKIEENHCY